jgi:hypothetical protein
MSLVKSPLRVAIAALFIYSTQAFAIDLGADIDTNNIVFDDGTTTTTLDNDLLLITDGTANTVIQNQFISIDDGAGQSIGIDQTGVQVNGTGTVSLTGAGNVDASGDVTALGIVQGTTVTDGTATLTGGSLTNAVDVTASGVVTGGTLTDGVASLNAGALTGVTTITTTGNVSVGGNLNMNGNTINNVGAGVLSTDAVNKGQLDAATTGINTQIGGLRREIGEVADKAYSGIAAAIAMTNLPAPIAGKRYSVGGGYGHYAGQNAFAVGVAANLLENVAVKASFSRTESETGAGVGFGYSW